MEPGVCLRQAGDGVGVELCWPYRAQQKGSVENLVGFVKSSFFKVRRFHDGEDLEQQLRDWEREVNEQRPCRATGIIPAVRLAEEASRLRALKVQPEELALRIPVYVGPAGTVVHQGHAYSMPPEAISMAFRKFRIADNTEVDGFVANSSLLDRRIQCSQPVYGMLRSEGYS